MARVILIPFILTILFIILVFLLLPQSEAYFTALLARNAVNPSRYTFYSYLVLASDIVLPIPSSLVMFSNGMVLGIIPGFLLSMASLMSAAVIGYWIGALAKPGKKSDRYEQAIAVIEKHGYLAIILSRGIPVLAESICIVCGYSRVRFGKYMYLNALGLVPVTLVYSVCGNYAVSTGAFLLSFGFSIGLSGLLWFAGKRHITNILAKENTE